MQVACDIYLLWELTLEIIMSQFLNALYTYYIQNAHCIATLHKGAFNTVLPSAFNTVLPTQS